MNRSVLMISSTLAILATTQLVAPQFVAALFAFDTVIALFCLGVAVLTYGMYYGPLKILVGSAATSSVGLLVFINGLLMLNSPTLYGLRTAYLPVADMFAVVEAGIVLLMIGLAAKQPETLRLRTVLHNGLIMVRRRDQKQAVHLPLVN